VLLVTYSSKPRGGVVHTLALAEALAAAGQPVHLLALGDPSQGFFRPVAVPHTIVPAPAGKPDLESKVFASIDALAQALADLGERYSLVHTQDCIAARAACRVRDAGREQTVLRTVHHVEEFTTQALIDCQRRAIVDPDAVLVVSRAWQHRLRTDYGVTASVVPNGVDLDRFTAPDPALARRLRQRVGAAERPLLLSVGGIEPRKGSDTLIRALAQLQDPREPPPVLAVIGGHSFQDHRPYRERVLAMVPGLGLELGNDVVLAGTVPDEEVPAWYGAADVLAFPSVSEGWGLAVLEALAAGLPVIASDLPVFREYLRHGRDALLPPVGDADALAGALTAALDDTALRARLRASGHDTARRFGWAASARTHQRLYAALGRSTLRAG
jgi:glycosyltransferase-like protein